ncbi:MAG: hypothetical protein ACI4P5_01290, partial [Candidatus Fimadaptatus sp.]
WPSLAAGGSHKAAAAAKAAQERRHESRKATAERKATRTPPFAPAAERRVRTQRPAASQIAYNKKRRCLIRQRRFD